jgi:YVTN family beta-propeller protein
MRTGLSTRCHIAGVAALAIGTLLSLTGPATAAAPAKQTGRSHATTGSGSSTLFVVTHGYGSNGKVISFDLKADKVTGDFSTEMALPEEMVVVPGGRVGYVTNDFGAVTHVDLTTHKVHHILVREQDNQQGLAVTPDGKTVYVFCRSGVCPINTATEKVEPTIQIAGVNVSTGGNHRLVLTPDGKTLYAITTSGTLVPINVADNKAGPPIPIGVNPLSLVITPDGRTAYISSADHRSYVEEGTVVPVDLTARHAGARIYVGDNPKAIAVTPDGKSVFTSNYGSHDVTPIDVSTNTVRKPIVLGGRPGDLFVTPDGKSLYVANGRQGQLNVIDIGSANVRAAIRLADAPQGLAFSDAG